jgi:TRAP-type C4-dicarboxylate transport system permease small subunit
MQELGQPTDSIEPAVPEPTAPPSSVQTAEGQFHPAVLWVSRVMAAVAAITLGAMVIVAVIDVAGRSIFLRPLEGSFELGGILLVIAGTWGMGYCQIRRQNIRIDILATRFPVRMQKYVEVFVYIVCLATSALVAWRMALYTHEYMVMGRGSLTATLRMPYWPFMLMTTLGFLWLAVIFAIDLYLSVAKAVRR